jgi:hypothetical protein
VAHKNFYEILEIPPATGAVEIKRAFRQLIARYHPDKVQHLGHEFQVMAAGRAAELTEAYRILSNERSRAAYDATLVDGAAPRPTPPRPHAASPAEGTVNADPPPARSESSVAVQFEQERATRDEFVRKATMDKFRQAFTLAAGSGYDAAKVRGFDGAWIPKSRMFGGPPAGPRLLARFVVAVTAAAVSEAWVRASNWNVPVDDDICVILMGTSVAPQRELAAAISEQRLRPSRGGGHVTLIPVNASVWDAHMPIDAPAVAKELLARLNPRGWR